jgi:hypothetical protein
MDLKVVLCCDAVAEKDASSTDALLALKVVAAHAVICAEDPDCLAFVTPDNEADFGPLLSGRFYADQLVVDRAQLYNEAVSRSVRTVLEGGRLCIATYGTASTCHGAVFEDVLSAALKEMVRVAGAHSLNAQAAHELRLYQLRVSLVRVDVNSHAFFDVLNQGQIWLADLRGRAGVCSPLAVWLACLLVQTPVS